MAVKIQASGTEFIIGLEENEDGVEVTATVGDDIYYLFNLTETEDGKLTAFAHTGLDEDLFETDNDNSISVSEL